MREQDDNRSRGEQDETADLMVNSALARYSAVEPRNGLEERILANLQTQAARSAARSWLQWSLAATALAMIALAVGLGWRASRSPHPIIANRPRTTVEPLVEPGKQIAHRDGFPTRSQKPVLNHRMRLHVEPEQVATTNPKLDQFPAPQPLSDQEKLLLDYVGQYHAQAVLVARAREEQLQRDRDEEEAGRANRP